MQLWPDSYLFLVVMKNSIKNYIKTPVMIHNVPENIKLIGVARKATLYLQDTYIHINGPRGR